VQNCNYYSGIEIPRKIAGKSLFANAMVKAEDICKGHCKNKYWN